MNIQDKINDMTALKQTHEKEVQESKNNIIQEFEAFIKNKSIPLHERWKAFEKAPEELSDYLDVYPNCHYDEGQVGPGLDFFQDQLLPNIIDSYQYQLNFKDSFSLFLNEDGTADIKMVRLHLEDQDFTDEQLKEMIMLCAEEVLEKNLLGFTCDT